MRFAKGAGLGAQKKSISPKITAHKIPAYSARRDPAGSPKQNPPPRGALKRSESLWIVRACAI